MENNSLNQFIKKAIEYYDEQNITYIDTINTSDIILNTDSTIIIFKIDGEEKIYDYELLGYFDNQNNIWIWSWLLINLTSDQIMIARELLNYGLKLEPLSNSSEHFFIKSLLVNSRIMIEEDIQLEINLAIFSYIIKKKIKFIYPRKIFLNDEKKFITIYYLIK
jgi:hypothetical protein